MMRQAFQVRPGALYRRSKPVRSAKYLAFIRRQASVVSGFGPCEAVHTGPHAFSRKASDTDALPMTRREHLQYGANPDGFVMLHKLDIPALVRHYNRLYEEQGGTVT